MRQYRFLAIILALSAIGYSQEIKDERILVDEVGVEANVGLPYIVGIGLYYSLKIRDIPVYPSISLKTGVGPIVKGEFLFGLNYRSESTISYSLNFGYSGGETFAFDTHAGQPNKQVGLVTNFQRRKYVGESKYWCLSQVIGFDFKKQIDPDLRPEFYLFPYFEIGIIFMVI